jgi:hypothetical protein
MPERGDIKGDKKYDGKQWRLMCVVEGCTKSALDSETKKCRAHGGGLRYVVRCDVEGCTNAARDSKTKKCSAHGGGLRCDVEGCTKAAADSETMKCVAHGGGIICIVKGCTNAARNSKTKKCIAHGGGLRCDVEGCTKSAVDSKTMKCKAHGGGLRCDVEGCAKSAADSETMKCVAHGGGLRCVVEGCTKSAADSETMKCKAHGGGLRCDVEGCAKSAVDSKTMKCKAHGGGLRCVVEGCTKSAVDSKTKKCTAHGGGFRCVIEGCTKAAADSETMKCVAHGGGIRCPHDKILGTCTECPYTTVPRLICKICMSKRLSNRRVSLGICAECEPNAPERTEITFGKMIIEAFGYEPNVKDKMLATGSACNGLQKRRPDILWTIPGKVAVVLEIDEDSHVDRESSCELRKISEQNEAIQLLEGCECIPVYTIRVNPDAYDGGNVTKKERAEKVAGLLRDIIHGDHEYEQNGYMKVIFCYYHSKSRHHIDAHKTEFDCEEL